MTKAATKDKTKFNPNLGGAFSNDAFGKGAILLNITEENLKTLVENVRVGSAILFRFNKQTIKGNNHYFTEILPPMGATTVAKTTRAKAAASSELD